MLCFDTLQDVLTCKRTSKWSHTVLACACLFASFPSLLLVNRMLLYLFCITADEVAAPAAPPPPPQLQHALSS